MLINEPVNSSTFSFLQTGSGMKNRIKKFASDHQEALVVGAIATAALIAIGVVARKQYENHNNVSDLLDNVVDHGDQRLHRISDDSFWLFSAVPA